MFYLSKNELMMDKTEKLNLCNIDDFEPERSVNCVSKKAREESKVVQHFATVT